MTRAVKRLIVAFGVVLFATGAAFEAWTDVPHWEAVGLMVFGVAAFFAPLDPDFIPNLIKQVRDAIALKMSASSKSEDKTDA